MHKLRVLLFPFSVIYDLVTRVRNYLYNKNILKSESYPLPIICVGNLSVGGTGKSPMVLHLVTLLSKDHSVAVLSRGYGRKTKGFVEVAVDALSQEVGDEPLQLKKQFPQVTVVVCEDRKVALDQLKYKVDVVLMDDGFQHRRVKPSFSVLLTAFNSRYDNDFLLPAGNLRESGSNAKRADIIVVTKCPSQLPYATMQKIQYELNVEPHQKVFFSKIDYGSNIIGASETLPLDYLANKQFTLVTGIANPLPLVKHLKEKKYSFTHKKFGDHHEFTTTEIAKLKKEELIITTEKDFMRLQPLINKLAIYYLPIKTQFLNNGSPIFNTRIQEVVSGFKKAD